MIPLGTYSDDDQHLVKLPESAPWTAPEHHTSTHSSVWGPGIGHLLLWGCLSVCLSVCGLLVKGIPLYSTAGSGANTGSSFEDVLMSRVNDDGFLELSFEVVGSEMGHFFQRYKRPKQQFELPSTPPPSKSVSGHRDLYSTHFMLLLTFGRR